MFWCTIVAIAISRQTRHGAIVCVAIRSSVRLRDCDRLHVIELRRDFGSYGMVDWVEL
jgi:hypothetical protein